MLIFYIFIAVVVFLVFVVKYVYDKFYVAGDSCSTREEKLIVVGDLLKRLGGASIWLPVAIYYLVVHRQEIIDLYKRLFNKRDC